jgi:hypothetical protein
MSLSCLLPGTGHAFAACLRHFGMPFQKVDSRPTPGVRDMSRDPLAASETEEPQFAISYVSVRDVQHPSWVIARQPLGFGHHFTNPASGGR